ncbi:MAG: hypothetical protein JNM83_17790 [Myxococcales bacterium]|nr:hypothetical protein [Myxococcales bacterium]
MRGLSSRNLKYMRAFAKAWPEENIVQDRLAQLTWFHQIALLEKLRGFEGDAGHGRQSRSLEALPGLCYMRASCLSPSSMKPRWRCWSASPISCHGSCAISSGGRCLWMRACGRCRPISTSPLRRSFARTAQWCWRQAPTGRPTALPSSNRSGALIPRSGTRGRAT